MTNTTTTAKELAEKLGTDPKTVRRFLRSVLPEDARPGRGGRYALDAKAIKALEERFTTWKANSARVISVEDLIPTEG